MRLFLTLIKEFRRRASEHLACGVIAALGRDARMKRTMLRRIFTSHLMPGCRVLVELDDHRFLVDPKDTQVSFSLMNVGEWQRGDFQRAVQWLSQRGRLRANAVFVDVGANIGTQTVYALLSGKFGKAVAIEPEPNNFALLQRNIELNGMADRAVLLHKGASSGGGSVSLNIDPQNSGGHSLEPARALAGSGSLKVEIDRVATLVSGLGIEALQIGLVWIDVEGHELDVIEGLGAIRESGVPLVVEINVRSRSHDGIGKLRELLQPHYDTVVDVRALSTDPELQGTPLRELSLPDGVYDLLIC